MKPSRGGFRMLRHEQLLQEVEHDAYRPRRKLAEPARCPECGAVYRRGRWTWGAARAGAQRARCPACQRIRAGHPAGIVTLSGAFFRAHREEIVEAVRRCEAAERLEHALERLMAIEPNSHATVITTTGAHLARRIGEALRRAYKGELELRYGKADSLLRVSWRR